VPFERFTFGVKGFSAYAHSIKKTPEQSCAIKNNHYLNNGMTTYSADIASYSDYYPYGMLLQGEKLLAGATSTGTEQVLVPENVQYANITNASVGTMNELEIVDVTTNSWSSGASSSQTVEMFESISFFIESLTNNTVVGLTYSDNSTGQLDANYGIYLQGNEADVTVNGTIVQVNEIFAIGDVFSIFRDGVTIRFLHNGAQIHSVIDLSSNPMYADVAMNSDGSSYAVYNLLVNKLTTVNTYASTDYVPAYGNENDYRYGFQGQEMDDEVKGKGNSVNYKYRMHDPRIGRFFARDPLAPKYPWYTPYQFTGNKVIAYCRTRGVRGGSI